MWRPLLIMCRTMAIILEHRATSRNCSGSGLWRTTTNCVPVLRSSHKPALIDSGRHNPLPLQSWLVARRYQYGTGLTQCLVKLVPAHHKPLPLQYRIVACRYQCGSSTPQHKGRHVVDICSRIFGGSL
jgi:hypothetical protein